jgi:signal transduction histidine kinase
LKKYQPGLGLIIATFVTISLLPIRLSEGQGKNPINLIGSEVVIWLLFLSCWLGAQVIHQKIRLAGWKKIILSVALCIVLSNVFYHLSNPFFEDFPMAPIRNNSFWVGILRLSIRGALVSIMLVPVIAYVHRERRLQNEKLEAEKRHARELEQRNRLLEESVAERTAELQSALTGLDRANQELDNQIYLLSRLLASITHDVQAPFSYALLITKNINRLVNNHRFDELPQFTQGLESSLESMFSFMSNLLAFIKARIKDEPVYLGWTNLPGLINEKVQLFSGIVAVKNNTLKVAINEQMEIRTNENLFAIVVHNLLDNATKYTDNGIIQVYTAELDQQQYLIIENSGGNMPAHVIDWLNSQHDPESNRNFAPNQSLGIGLILAREITALLNARFFIRTEGDKTLAYLSISTRPAPAEPGL